MERISREAGRCAEQRAQWKKLRWKHAAPVETEMESCVELEEAEMEPHAEQGRREKLGRKRGEGFNILLWYRYLGKLLKGMHSRSAKEVHRQAAEEKSGRGSCGDEKHKHRGRGC